MKTFIGVTTLGNIETKTVSSLMGLVKPEGTTAFFTERLPIQIARNQIVEYFLKSDCDYLLFIDSDMIFPYNALTELLNAKVDYISGLAFYRTQPHFPAIYQYNKTDNKFNPIAKYEPNSVIEIDGSGMAFTLISRKVFKKLKEPYFEWTNFSEDLTFCKKLYDKGIKMYCHTGVKLGHISQRIITEETFINEVKKQKGFVDLLRKVPKKNIKIEKYKYEDTN